MKTLRGELLKSLFIGSVITLFLLGLFVNFEVREEVQELLDYQIEQIALTMLGENPIVPEKIKITLEEDLNFIIQVWESEKERPFLVYGGEGNLPPRSRIPGFIWTEDGNWRIFSYAGDKKWVQVSQSVKERRIAAFLITLSLMGPILLFMIPALGVVVIFSVKKGLSPLEEVARHLHGRKPYSLSPFPEEGLPKEIIPLVKELNALLDRLSEALKGKDIFLANAAHELRTPVTAVSLQVQLARRADTVEAQKNTLVDLEKGVMRISHLIDQLLAYARVGSFRGVAENLFENVSMSAVVREAMTLLLPLALEKKIDFGLDCEDPVMVTGEKQSLLTMVINLLDNALRYTPAGGVVTVSLLKEENAKRLVITDSGPGIPRKQRQKVFERFYRCQGVEIPGNGLGLSIVKHVAETHGITVTFDDPPSGSGLRVTLSFPGSDVIWNSL